MSQESLTKETGLLQVPYKIVIRWTCPKCRRKKQQRLAYFTIRHYKDLLHCECGTTLVIKRGFAVEYKGPQEVYPDSEHF